MQLSRHIIVSIFALSLLSLTTLGCEATRQVGKTGTGGGIPQGQTATDFRTWAGDDDQIDEGEFQGALVNDQIGIFDGWDEDNDRNISVSEFNRAVFNIWDDDQDNALTRYEFQDVSQWFQEGQMRGDFDTWDTDNDTRVSFSEATNHSGQLFNLWDHDGDETLTSGQFAEHAFVVWDSDNNDHIDQNEWSEHVGAWMRGARRPAS